MIRDLKSSQNGAFVFTKILLSQEPQAKMFAAGDHLKQLIASFGPSGTGASCMESLENDEGGSHQVRFTPIAVV